MFRETISSVFLVLALCSGGAPASAAEACVAGSKGGCIPTTCFVETRDSSLSWHFASQCLRAYRDALLRPEADGLAPQIGDSARRYVDALLRLPGGGDGVLFERNDRGEPFNAMGQSGVAYFLLQLTKVARISGQPDLANDLQGRAYRLLEVLARPVAEGGFILSAKCGSGSCAWFQSVTRRDWRAGEGGTLNQNLHAIRDILAILDSGGLDDAALERELEGRVSAALRRLLEDSPGGLPSLAGYFPQSSAIAFYGARLRENRAPAYYFLSNGGLDCHYHVHATDLLFQIVDLAERRPALRASVDQAKSCGSPVRRYHAAVLRLAEPGGISGVVCPAGEARTHVETRGAAAAVWFDHCR